MRPDKLAIIALSIVTVVTGLTLSAHRAEACSVASGWELPGDTLALPESVPPDGVVPVPIIGWNTSALDGLPTIEVTDANGEVVAGEVSTVNLASPGTAEGRTDMLLVWHPDAQLHTQASYTLRLQVERNSVLEPFDASASFETSADPTASLTPVRLEASPAVTEREAGYECCSDSSFCDSCDNDCSKCWPTRYAYLPTINAVIQRPSAEAQPQVYYEVRANEQVRRRLWKLDAEHAVAETFDEAIDEPFCVDVVTVALRDGSEVSTEETCFTRADLPSYDERALAPSPPEACAKKLDAESSACSAGGTRPHAPPGALLLALVCAGGFAVRRRAC